MSVGSVATLTDQQLLRLPPGNYQESRGLAFRLRIDKRADDPQTNPIVGHQRENTARKGRANRSLVADVSLCTGRVAVIVVGRANHIG